MLQVKRRNCIFSDEKNVENAEINAFKTYSQVEKSYKVLLNMSSLNKHLSNCMNDQPKLIFVTNDVVGVLFPNL